MAAAYASLNGTDAPGMYGTSDDLCLSAYELGGTPWDEPERYAAMSPLTHVARVRTPTLVLHGEDDQIVPVKDSAKKSARLIKGAKEIYYPGAPHGLTATHQDQVNADLLAFIAG